MQCLCLWLDERLSILSNKDNCQYITFSCMKFSIVTWTVLNAFTAQWLGMFHENFPFVPPPLYSLIRFVILISCVWDDTLCVPSTCTGNPREIWTHWGWHRMAANLQRTFLNKVFVWNENYCNLIQISLKFVSKGPINHNPAFGSDNGLVPNRWQAIIWTNDGLVYWNTYRHYTVKKG